MFDFFPERVHVWFFSRTGKMPQLWLVLSFKTFTELPQTRVLVATFLWQFSFSTQWRLNKAAESPGKRNWLGRSEWKRGHESGEVKFKRISDYMHFSSNGDTVQIITGNAEKFPMCLMESEPWRRSSTWRIATNSASLKSLSWSRNWSIFWFPANVQRAVWICEVWWTFTCKCPRKHTLKKSSNKYVVVHSWISVFLKSWFLKGYPGCNIAFALLCAIVQEKEITSKPGNPGENDFSELFLQSEGNAQAIEHPLFLFWQRQHLPFLAKRDLQESLGQNGWSRCDNLSRVPAKVVHATFDISWEN